MTTPMRTVSFKLPASLDDALDELARDRDTSRSTLFREAVEALTANAAKRSSVTARAGRLVGSLTGPPDLSTNPEHLDGFGK